MYQELFSKAPRALCWTFATVPLVITFKDSFFWVMSVKGSSMEPTFQSGDLLLVRKADFPWWRKLRTGGSIEVDENFWKEDPNDTSIPSMRYRRIRDYEFQQSQLQDGSLVYQSPPTAMRGQIVSYRSPYKYPPERCVKRVVGVAGQVVETQKGLRDVGIKQVWVEGDNPNNSSDSRNFGTVNQGLILGVVEYCLWPPSRMGKVESKMDDKRSYFM